MTRAALILALILSGCTSPIHRDTYRGVEMVMNAPNREPCATVYVNNVCEE